MKLVDKFVSFIPKNRNFYNTFFIESSSSTLYVDDGIVHRLPNKLLPIRIVVTAVVNTTTIGHIPTITDL